MPFITVGTTSQLQVKVPTRGSTGWDETMRTDTFLKIAEHDHTGSSGKGVQLAAGAFANDGITGAKIRLNNDEYLRGRNAANSADKNIIKVNASDELEFGTTVGIVTIQDDGLTILDNADNTKIIALNASNITTGTTRTLSSPDATGTLVLEDNTATLSSKTLTSPVLNGTLSGTAFLDEDDLSSDSDIAAASQQSIKAYVDAQVTAQDLDITTDSGTIAIDLDSETLTIAGGTGIDSSAATNTVTLAIDSTVVTKTDTQTLTNKTLSGNTATSLISGSGTLTLNTSGTATVPNATDTLVGKATTDTLTNKTIDADGTGNSITNIEDANIKAAAAIDASKLADGSVSDTEFQYINTLSSNAQTQIDGKLPETITTTGDIIYSSSGTTAARLGIGTAGQALIVSGGVPAWGATSGGSLDILYQENFESITDSDWSTGDNATFLSSPTSGNGGTTGTTDVSNTSSPLNATGDLIYTQHVSAGSDNDYIASPAITVAEKHQENYIGLVLNYSYTGDDDDINVVIYDATNSVVLEEKALKASTSVSRYSMSAYVPNGVTSLKWGIQTQVQNNSKVLHIDDVEMTSNPYVIQDVDNISDWTAFTPTGSFTTNTTYTGFWRRVGDTMEIQWKLAFAGAPNSVSSTIDLPSGYTIDTAKLSSGTNVENYTLGTACFQDASSDELLVAVRYADTNSLALYRSSADGTHTYVSNPVTESQPATIASGDSFYVSAKVPISGWSSTTEKVVSYNAKNATNSMVRVRTGASYGSSNTYIMRFSTTDVNTGSAITYADSSTLGASFTVNEDGVYSINYTGHANSGGSNADQYIGVSLNTANGAASILTTKSEILCLDSCGYEAGEYLASSAWTGELSKGDVVRPHVQNVGAANTETTNLFAIAKIGTKELHGIPLPLVGYVKDSKTSGTEGGSSSATTTHTRDLTVSEGDFTKFGSLSSNQFTLDAGTYDIEMECPSLGVDQNKAFLYNTTDSTTDIVGQIAYSRNSSSQGGNATLKGRITITSSKTFEARHYTKTASGTNGLGTATNDGSVEIYTVVKITKVL